MAVDPEQLPVLVTEDGQGGLEAGRVPGLDHLLHQLQGKGCHHWAISEAGQDSSTPSWARGWGSGFWLAKVWLVGVWLSGEGLRAGVAVVVVVRVLAS